MEARPYLPIPVRIISRRPISLLALLYLKHFVFSAEFVSPALVRSARRQEKGERYKERKLAQEERGVRRSERKREEDPLAVGKVFA